MWLMVVSNSQTKNVLIMCKSSTDGKLFVGVLVYHWTEHNLPEFDAIMKFGYNFHNVLMSYMNTTSTMF